MKRLLLSILTLFVVLTGTAQVIGEAFYVYRNDGQFNAFLREEVDSIAYSYYDSDSLYHEDIVNQVVYTPDSTYWIPLASIDSVSFVTPETKYNPQVIKLEPLLPYIVGVDGMKLTFSSDTPSNLFPRKDDILVLESFDYEQFPTGFAGRMSSKDGLQITCDSVSIEDIYEELVCYGFYTAVDDSSSTENHQVRFATKRKIEGTVSAYIPINETVGSKGTGVYASVDVRLGLDLRFTFKYRKGEPTYFDISLTPELRCSLEAGAEGTISKTLSLDVPLLTIPIGSTPFYFKIMGGPVLEASLKASVVAKTEARLGYKFGIKYENDKFKWNGGNSSKDFSVPDVSGNINGSIFVGLKLGLGIYSYGNIVSTSLDNKEGVELEANISENIKSPNIFSYNELKDNYLNVNLKASADFNAKAKLFNLIKLSAKMNLFSEKLNVYKFKLVPSFTTPDVSLEKNSAIVSVIPDDNLLFPVQLGTGLWDEDSTLLDVQFCEGTYRNRKSWPLDEYRTVFPNLTFNKDYTVRPLFKLLGGMIVAPQEESFKFTLKPVTLAVSKVDDTLAEVRGRIDRHELLDTTMTFGLAYEEPESKRIIRVSTSSIDEDGIFYVAFNELKPNTHYNYFAYLIIDGKEYQGEKRRFKTKDYDEFKEPYFVWDGVKRTATYYYDGKCESQGGVKISTEHDVDNYAKIVIFDSSFSRYYPKRFWFIGCKELNEIKNLNYLNTDSITDMRAMFLNCRSLTQLDLSHFNTSNVTRFRDFYWSMFNDCSSLTSLDLSSFDTSNATDISNLFKGCSSLTSLDLSSFNTSNVTNMSSMFEDCISLITLDLSSFKFNKHLYIWGMFNNCQSLKTIYAGNWNQDAYYNPPIFSGCPNLTGGKGTKVGQNFYGYDKDGNPLYYNVESYRSIYCRIDGGKDCPGLFTAK